MDGLEAIKIIREQNPTIPIIIFSAHTEQEYLWRAVELKITKFIKKPYNKDMFIQALEQASLELSHYNTKIRLKNSCIYDPTLKNAIYNNKTINLSKQESRLLEYLYDKANEVVSFEDIFNYLWEFDTPSKGAIKAIVKELRKKLGSDCLKNIYGIGYMLESE